MREIILLSQDKPIVSLLFTLYLLSSCPKAHPCPALWFLCFVAVTLIFGQSTNICLTSIITKRDGACWHELNHMKAHDVTNQVVKKTQRL